jgi:putative RecB family exonuclease
MNLTPAETPAERLPCVSPSRLEAWDRCPAAYRFEYVLRLAQPIADQRPRLIGSVAHALVEAYVREAQATGTRPPLDRLPALARDLVTQQTLPEEAGTALAREATALLSAWLARGVVPLEHAVAVEHALAIDAGGRHVDWDAPDAFLRGRLDLVAVDGRQATVCDWKSGWLTEDDETLPWLWAPGCYAALLWAWAPRLEAVTVEYHYLRTHRVARTVFTPADAAETLAWARATAARIAQALATPDDPGAFPPRPSTACATCPWVNRCPAGRAALEAMEEAPIPDDVEARRLAGLLLAGEARVGRLRDRLKRYLDGRPPLAFDGTELGFYPTKGRYEAQAVFRALGELGADPWPLLSVDARALTTFLKRHPELERKLAPAWSPSPPWFGHRKARTAEGARRDSVGQAGIGEVRREMAASRVPSPLLPDCQE